MKSEIKLSGKRLHIARTFSAARPMVFSYWKYAEKMEKWWRLRGAIDCEMKIDFRPGGSFVQKIRIAGAQEVSISGEYEEILEPKRITYRVQVGPTIVRVQVNFLEQGAHTKVVMTHDALIVRGKLDLSVRQIRENLGLLLLKMPNVQPG